MVEKPSFAARPPLDRWAGALGAALSEIETDLAAGEPADAERRAKAVAAFARAVREVAAIELMARAAAPQQDVEEIRAELRRRLDRFVEAASENAADDVLIRIASKGDAE